MQLVLRLRDGWTSVASHPPDGARHTIRVSSDVTLDVDAFVAAPDEPRSWIEQIMARDVPPGARLRDLTPVPVRNELGWPMEVTVGVIVDADGAVLETRMGAFYKFQEWAASALARARSHGALKDARVSLLEAFASGRPEWKSPTSVAALAELWE